MAKFSVEEFISAIKEMSVLELNELVKAIEEEFGVSAAAPVAVAAVSISLPHKYLRATGVEQKA